MHSTLFAQSPESSAEPPPAAATNAVAADRPARPRARIDGDAQLAAPVGMVAPIRQVFFPGTELIPDPGSGPAAGLMVVRMDGVYPHGDGFRYDVSWSGEKPGEFDLTQWLRRKDGTSTADLPELPVKVTSLLAPERFTPNDLRPPSGGWVGGYRVLLGLLGFFWLAGLAALLWFRPKASGTGSDPSTGRSRLEQIRGQLEAVLGRGELSTADKASLETLIVGFWREQRRLTALEPAILLQTLLADPESGPLLRQLERWLYDRPQRADAAELQDLLAPLQRLVDQSEQSVDRSSR
ncbi:MAG: hypothetical protein ACKO2P_18785 [Planctomycetota bacterium]